MEKLAVVRAEDQPHGVVLVTLDRPEVANAFDTRAALGLCELFERFQAEQRIDFLNMQHTLDLYKAEHNRFPRTQDEFMKEIIQAGGIQLPDLPEGERYVYDPKTGELMVERPAPGQPASP